MTPADTQAALAAATATLESPGDPLAWLHARDVLALVACVSALRDVLAQTERERDEARRTLRFIDRIADATMRLAEATTRRLCAFLGCDPGPLLDAAAKCEEAMR